MNGKIIRRITAWIMALLIVFSASRAVASSAPETGEKILTVQDADQSFEKGVRAERDGVTVVSLYGTWREMGRQYGMLMQDRLAEVYGFVETIIDYGVGNAEKASSIIAKQTRQTPYRINQFF